MTSEATFFQDDTTVATLAALTPAASFLNGCNLAGSCAPGIGINMNEGEVVGTFEQFTLLDQHGDARAAQISQHIGGDGLGDGQEGTLPDDVIQFGDSPTQAAKDADPSLDGTIIAIGNSTLTTLLGGWVIQP